MDASKRKYMEAFVFFSTILCHEKQFQKGGFLTSPFDDSQPYTNSLKTISSARARMLFIRATHVI